LCHPSDIFCHHQNPSLGGSGSARPPRNALARPWPFPIWPPPLAGPPGWACSSRPHKWASAFDRHIFTDARSASLRELGLWLVSELSPLGKIGLGWRPSEGRAPHDRQGKPLAPPRHSASGHRLLLNPIGGPCPVRSASERARHATNTSSRTRGAHPSANDIRANQHSVCFSRKATRSGLAPRRVGLRTTAKESPGPTVAFRLWQPALAQPHRMFGLCTTAIQGPAAFIEAFPSATYPCSIHCG